MYRSMKQRTASRADLQLLPGAIADSVKAEGPSWNESELHAAFSSMQEQVKQGMNKPDR